MSWLHRRRLAAVTILLSGAPLIAGCSGAEEPSATPSSPTSSAPPPLTTTAELGTTSGRVPAATADRAKTAIAKVVDGWIDAAYVGGDYPRSTFADAFPGFTKGAQAKALADRRLMSNADIGARIDSVTAGVRRVRVDVLAVDKQVRAATAHVRLGFTTTGQEQRRVLVTGRLLLTYVKGVGWRVFAYDIAKGDR